MSEYIKKVDSMSEDASQRFKSSLHGKYAAEIKALIPEWKGDIAELGVVFNTSPEQMSAGRTALSFGLSSGGTIKNPVTIEVTSLRELFRGNGTTGRIEKYPPEFVPFFMSIEQGLDMLDLDPAKLTDEAFIEVYSAMRRRPDGKSLGFLHDAIWQRAAAFLIARECSQQEFEECFRRLEGAARSFRMNPTSRNYYHYLAGEEDQFDYAR